MNFIPFIDYLDRDQDDRSRKTYQVTVWLSSSYIPSGKSQFDGRVTPSPNWLLANFFKVWRALCFYWIKWLAGIHKAVKVNVCLFQNKI